ncbi:MAG: hypothetical protein K0B07_05005 [DPANN group archaeon]|nr:hypothetical protein [DPANN group archaeon]
MVMFYSIGEPEYIQDKELMDFLLTIYKNKNYIIIGKETSCIPQKIVDSSYISSLGLPGKDRRIWALQPIS